MSDYLIIPFFTPVLISMFWFFELLFSSGSNQRAKKHLAFFFLCGAISFLMGFLYFNEFYLIYSATYFITGFFFVSQLPAFYIYLISITEKSIDFKRYIMHFTAPLLVSLTVLYFHYIHISTKESAVVLANFYSPENLSGNLKTTFIVDLACRIFFLGLSVFYFFLIHLKAKKHLKKVYNYYSNTYKKNLYWVRVSSILYIGMFILGGIIFNPGSRDSFEMYEYIVVIPFFSLGVIFWFIGFMGNRQPVVAIPNDNCVQGKQLILNSDQKDNIISFLTDIVDSKQAYLNPELSLPDLAKQIGTNRFYLSKVINEKFGVNFNSYINDFRVAHALKLIKENTGNVSFSEISVKSGFNSYTSFARSFKKITGKSPDRYINKLDSC